MSRQEPAPEKPSESGNLTNGAKEKPHPLPEAKQSVTSPSDTSALLTAPVSGKLTTDQDGSEDSVSRQEGFAKVIATFEASIRTQEGGAVEKKALSLPLVESKDGKEKKDDKQENILKDIFHPPQFNATVVPPRINPEEFKPLKDKDAIAAGYRQISSRFPCSFVIRKGIVYTQIVCSNQAEDAYFTGVSQFFAHCSIPQHQPEVAVIKVDEKITHVYIEHKTAPGPETKDVKDLNFAEFVKDICEGEITGQGQLAVISMALQNPNLNGLRLIARSEIMGLSANPELKELVGGSEKTKSIEKINRFLINTNYESALSSEVKLIDQRGHTVNFKVSDTISASVINDFPVPPAGDGFKFCYLPGFMSEGNMVVKNLELFRDLRVSPKLTKEIFFEIILLLLFPSRMLMTIASVIPGPPECQEYFYKRLCQARLNFLEILKNIKRDLPQTSPDKLNDISILVYLFDSESELNKKDGDLEKIIDILSSDNYHGINIAKASGYTLENLRLEIVSTRHELRNYCFGSSARKELPKEVSGSVSLPSGSASKTGVATHGPEDKKSDVSVSVPGPQLFQGAPLANLGLSVTISAVDLVLDSTPVAAQL